MIKKVVIIGPESTGKSTLCKQLAAHYQTTWVKEYARDYLLTKGRDYNFNTLLDIAKGQINLEEKGISIAESQNSPLFIDTDMYVMKVWCEYVFEKCHHWILNRILEREYSLYLLCDTDLPWTADELREYPDLESRQRLFRHYKDSMINQHTPWAIISGTDEERLKRAITAVEKIR